MTFVLALVTILQSIGISLGVGSSTLAIANFFAAIADGTIDETERRMMGIVYIVLRVAMVLILATTLFLIAYDYLQLGLFATTPFMIGQFVAIAVLYINAVLMTHHLIPSTFGPALQGGTWYTLGTLSALQILGYTTFSLGHFFMGYITWLVLAVGIVNGFMWLMRTKREEREAEEAQQTY